MVLVGVMSEAVTMTSAYEEILDFITSAPTLEQIVAFRHSEATVQRVAYLNERKQAGKLSRAEKDELREFERSAHFIEQLKVRAQRRIELGES
jgi:hypothetical protein